jgi:hypothetical protein
MKRKSTEESTKPTTRTANSKSALFNATHFTRLFAPSISGENKAIGIRPSSAITFFCS